MLVDSDRGVSEGERKQEGGCDGEIEGRKEGRIEGERANARSATPHCAHLPTRPTPKFELGNQPCRFSSTRLSCPGKRTEAGHRRLLIPSCTERGNKARTRERDTQTKRGLGSCVFAPVLYAYVYVYVCVYREVLSFTTFLCSLATRSAIRGREAKCSFSSSFGDRYQRYRLLFSLLVARSSTSGLLTYSRQARSQKARFWRTFSTAKSLPSLDSSGPAFLPLKSYAPVYFLTTFALFARFHAYLYREEFSNVEIDRRSFGVSAAGCCVDFAKSVVLIGLTPRSYISARYFTRALLTRCARSLCRPVLIINHRLAWE